MNECELSLRPKCRFQKVGGDCGMFGVVPSLWLGSMLALQGLGRGLEEFSLTCRPRCLLFLPLSDSKLYISAGRVTGYLSCNAGKQAQSPS
eukprot:3448194-Amphidinium_carterae.1